MRIVCTKKKLSVALGVCARIIGSGNTLPILNNILFKTDQGRLKISATNLEMAINTWVGGKIEEEGEITIPARLVNEYITNLATDRLVISTKNQTLTLEGEKTQTHIKGLSSDEFPLIPKVSDSIFTKLDGKTFQKAIGEVGFAASYSETQPEISGISFCFEEKTLTLAATDRYRLAEEKIGLIEEVAGLRQVILPSRAASEAARIMNGEVEIYLSEGQICFRSTDSELISRLIDGQYPDYKQIIPKHFTTEAIVVRGGLVQAIKASSLFAAENNNIELEINPQGKQLVVKGQSVQLGDSEINLEAEIQGQKNSIIFNYHYILDCLNSLTDEKVGLKAINPSSPVEIVPIGREDYLYIVMPIKV